MDVFTEEQFSYEGFDVLPETKFFTYDQVQQVKVKNGSESTWQISSDYKAQFKEMIHKASNQTDPSNITILMTLETEFNRPVRINF